MPVMNVAAAAAVVRRILGRTIELDASGFVVIDGALQSSVPGIFAAGDCRQGSTRQAASAGEGAAAALAIRRYIEPLVSGMPSPSRVEQE
ncbi:MAG: hypothetical protein GEU28_08925 [Dehalococcoidia bacterium]|nr:hypothetical protein [Dehalococcoidia bacterium]